MSDDLRERIALAIARVPAGKAADAVLDAIAETAVIVERGRWERVLTFATWCFREEFTDCDAWRNWENAKLQPGDLEPLP